MKFVSVLILICCELWSNFPLVDSNACMAQKYQPDKYKYLRAQFRSEFPRLSHLSKMIFGTSSATSTSKLSDDLLKQLCTCAIFKVDDYFKRFYGQRSAKSIESLMTNMQVHTFYVNISISYILFSYPHRFPVTVCVSGEDVKVIVMGLRQKSAERRIYDIYVGYIEPLIKSYNFEGVIKDVDVDIPIDEIYYSADSENNTRNK